MKTRTQPERRARKSKLESGRQTKKAPKKAKVSSPSLRRGRRRGRRRRQRIRALAAVEEVGAVALASEGAASAAGRPGNPYFFSVAAATAAAPRCNPVLKGTVPCYRLLPLRRPVAIAGAACSPLQLTRHRYALMPLSSWLQLKQQIQAAVSAASVQSSTESVLPIQLKMPKKKPQHEHIWTDTEEKALVDIAGIVAAGVNYQANKKEFAKRVAVMMNTQFQANHEYVPLDASKVKHKLDRYKECWEAQEKQPSGSKKMYTTSGGKITGRDQLWTQLFSPSEATRSDAGSKKRKSREDTTPKDKESALKYMMERESSVAARLIFAAALACPNILSVFLCLDGYQSRRQHLIEVWKTGIVRVPEVEGIHPNCLPPDFQ